MRAPRRILLVRLSHLGDVVHALPLYHALRAEHPRARIAWAVQPEFAELVAALPGIDRVVRFERRGGAGAWPRLARELAAFRPDWTVDAQGNLKSALVTLCSRAERRSGWHVSDWTERFGAHVLDDPAPPAGARARHAVERVLHLARHVAPGGAERVPWPWLRPHEAARSAAEARLAGWFGARAAPLVVHLSGPGDVRSWPLERFAALARELAARARPALFVAGPAESAVGRALQRQLAGLEGVACWADQRGLGQLAALFAAAADRGGRLVACDSGPLHLAAACGLATTLLAGPQDAARTGPWPPPGPGSPHRVVTADDAPPCAPCLARRCAHASGPVCMTRIEPTRVAEALDRG